MRYLFNILIFNELQQKFPCALKIKITIKNYFTFFCAQKDIKWKQMLQFCICRKTIC